jgi:hypothetical protein
MADLNEPQARLLIARGELGIKGQHLNIRKRELRMMEIEVEVERIGAENKVSLVQITEIEKSLPAIPKTDLIGRARAEIDRDERSVIIDTKNVRLLELEEERLGVIGDIAASRDHITKLQAEVSQQQARLKMESPNG